MKCTGPQLLHHCSTNLSPAAPSLPGLLGHIQHLINVCKMCHTQISVQSSVLCFNMPHQLYLQIIGASFDNGHHLDVTCGRQDILNVGQVQGKPRCVGVVQQESDTCGCHSIEADLTLAGLSHCIREHCTEIIAT